jgi:hypothetical protein
MVVSDTFTLSGAYVDRVRQALRVAEHQARVAQAGGHGRHVEDTLVEIEEAIAAQLAQLETALDDDRAEAEESGAAERDRHSWSPRYRAA